MSKYPDKPGHRNIDTSIAAANALAPKVGRLQKLVYDPICTAGQHGRTTDELTDLLDMERYSVQPRTTELKRKGLIRDSGKRRPSRTGKASIVWIAV